MNTAKQTVSLLAALLVAAGATSALAATDATGGQAGFAPIVVGFVLALLFADAIARRDR